MLNNKEELYKSCTEINEINNVLNKIDDYRSKGLFNESLDLMESFIEVFEEVHEELLNKNIYHFNESLEELLTYILKETDNINKTDIPINNIYTQYGSVLIDNDRYDEAKKILEKALRYNPVNARALFEYAECLKRIRDYESFLEMTIITLNVVFNVEDIAHCYRNVADYLTEKRKYREAFNCLSYSLTFDNSYRQMVKEDTEYLIAMGDIAPNKPTQEELFNTLDKYDIPHGASEDVINVAIDAAKELVRLHREIEAYYFYDIVYNLGGKDKASEIFKNK